MKERINLVFIGHVDHGKSTLIGRLLYDAGKLKKEKIEEVEAIARRMKKGFEFAFVMDNLEEEREGGLTIDTIQIGFDSKKYSYNIIDCPGHLEFIKNMLTGASQADAAILLLSAQENERIQDQTKRHLFLANLFGIKQLFVAVNKMDTVKYDENIYNTLKKNLRNYLASINFAAKNIIFIPISAKCGDNVWRPSDNMKWYTGPTLIAALDSFLKTPILPTEKPLRLVVQDVYDFGEEKMIVGRIETGALKTGDEVIFDPSGIKAKIKSIEEFNEKKEKTVAGECVGLTLEENSAPIKRGDVCSHPESRSNVIKKFKGKIFLLSNIDLKCSDVVSVRCGTADVRCKIFNIRLLDSRNGNVLEEDAKVVRAGDAAELYFETESPSVFENFSEIPQLGRFVVSKDNKIAAAGVVMSI